MTDKEILSNFIEAIELTPGVHSIVKKNDINIDDDNKYEISILQDEKNKWNFRANIKILKNSNAKSIIEGIVSLTKFKLKKASQKIGEVNIFIGGIAND
ncbi:Uncharacterised protein [Mycoplasmopsis maculosa]|uniref:Uncharacterized protein n=1 Tax=Mycoplasmopsis maculosa TaxID=114885 RepID=A0A449B5H8_9BACT|nr:hypothetical protein [Mycoplasmopsis maculosa]VEU75825.1 Uncharacterised protein [Mycoplasmopsis maculosa]